jgi:beta-glucosidase
MIDLKVLRRLRAAGVPTVAVFLSGRPLWVNREINAADAFVAAWLPGSEGEGVADLLFRSAAAERYDFTGRLAFSWPKTAMPVSFDTAGKVSGALFARGYGLSYGSGVDALRLSEDPRIPPHWAGAPGGLFHEGHVTAPWSVFVADGSSEVHLTTSTQESPEGAVAVTLERGEVKVRWSGARSGTFRISGRASDLRRRAAQGAALDILYRVDRAPERAVTMGLQCAESSCGTQAGAMLDVTRALKDPRAGEWRHLYLPLSCFTAAGADLSAVVAPFAVESPGRLELTITEVSLAQDAKARRRPCP